MANAFLVTTRRKCKAPTISTGSHFHPLDVEMSSDADDNDFVNDERFSSEASKTWSQQSDIQRLINTEVCFNRTGLDGQLTIIRLLIRSRQRLFGCMAIQRTKHA